MRSVDRIVIDSLNKQLSKFRPLLSEQIPDGGWFRAIRSALKIPRSVIANKMRMSNEAVRQLEMREKAGRVTINAMREAAAAMDMQFVYALVPRSESLVAYREEKAAALAKRIVLKTHQHMKLEAQQLDDEQLAAAISEVQEELLRNNDTRIWQ